MTHDPLARLRTELGEPVANTTDGRAHTAASQQQQTPTPAPAAAAASSISHRVAVVSALLVACGLITDHAWPVVFGLAIAFAAWYHTQ
jgi:hypothetical protein